MPISPKNWEDFPATTTPITAAALEDLETRLSTYTDDEIDALNIGTITAFAGTLLDDDDAAEFLTTLGISAFIQTLLNDADAATALTTLGVSAFIQTLLNDADASTALSTLGISAFAKTILDDADAAAVRTTIGAATSLGFTPEDVANKDTDGTFASNSNTRYPSQAAVKTYADTLASGIASVIPASAVSQANYTFVLADAGRLVELSYASAASGIVPASATAAFPVGAIIEVARMGTGSLTIVPSAGVTIRSPGNLTAIATQYDAVSLRKRAPNEWVLNGALV